MGTPVLVERMLNRTVSPHHLKSPWGAAALCSIRLLAALLRIHEAF